ncbi:MAG: hypothetical protein FRX48_01077 [Lasallia pustulata]|uniref:Uncharacterized protein n=1 Tax=Lasallia pustulata TaxID=136370 RepID=A0A5M8Q4P4_9LECA|nr:MAG: hypothetical protein FRX48_01077 [Lasallia pustulata]
MEDMKRSRDAVKRLITQIAPTIVFDENDEVSHNGTLDFVTLIAAVSMYDPRICKRTILKSSVLSQLPEQSLVLLKYFRWPDELRYRRTSWQSRRKK